ncbi:hypothetical protein ACCO45_009949 [Purpureocillium lilacinum]|uniref:Uncharacterized protein n=1 Tax=Purpureocillium lilacinum TaxID=33203 RepID=A0ACC4DG27_PURLI
MSDFPSLSLFVILIAALCAVGRCVPPNQPRADEGSPTGLQLCKAGFQQATTIHEGNCTAVACQDAKRLLPDNWHLTIVCGDVGSNQALASISAKSPEGDQLWETPWCWSNSIERSKEFQPLFGKHDFKVRFKFPQQTSGNAF